MSKLDLSNYKDRTTAHIYHHFDGKFLKDISNPHRIYTPVNLCEEILEKIECTQDKLYLVMYNPEFVWVLKNKYNIDPEQIILWTLEYSEFHYSLSTKFGCIYYWEDFANMKFDAIIANPPFSAIRKGGVGLKKTGTINKENIFQDFFRKALEIAHTVAMIMPESNNGQVQTHMKEHNKLIEKKCREIIDIPEKMFPIKTWCIIADHKSEGIFLDNTNIELPERMRIKIRRGRANSANINREMLRGEMELPTGVSFEEIAGYKKVYQRKRKGKMIIHWADPYLHKQPHPGNGTTHLLFCGNSREFLNDFEIVEWNGEFVSNNLLYIACKSFDEANKRMQWMMSEDFKKIVKCKKLPNISSLQKLPDYKMMENNICV
jgi:hypothetical protein